MKRKNPYPKERLAQDKRSRTEMQPQNDKAGAIDIRRAAAAMDRLRKSTDPEAGVEPARSASGVTQGNHVSLAD